jgi:hypothetical protein
MVGRGQREGEETRDRRCMCVWFVAFLSKGNLRSGKRRGRRKHHIRQKKGKNQKG